jgi:hypothetical protein
LAWLSSRTFLLFGFTGCAQRDVPMPQLGLPIDRTPLCGRKSRRSRQNPSFDLLACLRKGIAVRRNILRHKIG